MYLASRQREKQREGGARRPKGSIALKEGEGEKRRKKTKKEEKKNFTARPRFRWKFRIFARTGISPLCAHRITNKQLHAGGLKARV